MFTPRRPAGRGAGLELESRMADGCAGAGWPGCAQTAAFDKSKMKTILGDIMVSSRMASFRQWLPSALQVGSASAANLFRESDPWPGPRGFAQFLYPDRSRRIGGVSDPQRPASVSCPSTDQAPAGARAVASALSRP